MRNIKSLQVIISGRVQGVWYRGWTVKVANSLGLDGWVCNRKDGTVEALISGVPEKVDEILDACLKGPEHARVTNITKKACDAPDKKGFFQL